jgi:hypothetical protein
MTDVKDGYERRNGGTRYLVCMAYASSFCNVPVVALNELGGWQNDDKCD